MEMITEDDFSRLWKAIDNSAYTEDERMELERIIVRIVCDHRYGSNTTSITSLFGLHVECTYFESVYEDCLVTDISEIHSLAVPMRESQGSITYTQRRGMWFALKSGNMIIQDFRRQQYRPGLLINWVAKSGIEKDVNFRFLMRVSVGSASDGFATVSELLSALRKWDAIANVLNSRSNFIYVHNTYVDHWSHFGDITCGEATCFVITPHTFPEIRYEVTPMWSPSDTFLSINELGYYLQLSKPAFKPVTYEIIAWKPMPFIRKTNPEFFDTIPTGVGDYVVDHDSLNFEWALLFSPRLGLYYKVTVRLSGTTLDHCSNLQSAFLVCSEPQTYIHEDINLAQEQVPCGQKYFRTVKAFYDDPLVKAADEA